MPKIYIQNEARTVQVEANENLRKALMRNKVGLYGIFSGLTNCRGHGHCGSCDVLVVEGAEHLTERTPKEIRKLQTYDRSRRLACQAAIIGDADITINTLSN